MSGISLPDESGSKSRLDAAVAGALAVLGVFLMEAGPQAEVAASEALRDTVLRPFLEAQAWFGRRIALEERLDELVEENVRLQARLLRRRALEEENRQIRTLLDLTDQGTVGQFIASRVVPAEPRLGVTRRFLLTASGARGVQAPAGVVTADGVLGVVRTVTDDAAVADFWTHPDFRVSVRVRDREITGIVRPDDRDEGPPVMLFAGAPYQGEIPPGSVLVTTGAGGVFPSGVPVGRVQEQASTEAGWARSYRVRPAVRPEEVSVALVWVGPTPTTGAAPPEPESGG